MIPTAGESSACAYGKRSHDSEVVFCPHVRYRICMYTNAHRTEGLDWKLLR
jgi:hypothetical protein